MSVCGRFWRSRFCHVILHKFAENYNDAGTAVSTDNAAASKNVFFDDRTYKMGIGANRTDAGMTYHFV